ncbi:hypothetical protein [Streptomyces cacaoi]|uniref:Uncharacterized protein n=1 Tax=Streptomyces cacaoi TaxID=1898 RepID=A0A4Y3R8W6_STRCI|nr:hypothetical protein [Streptomyces cacaoi]GEB54111.1 hypothetical protein SCA03_66620 [Streptomyces cacaoi]
MGESFIQRGRGNIGQAIHYGAGDIVAGGKTVGSADPKEAAISELLAAIAEVREHLDDVRRAEIEAAAQEVRPERTRQELEGPLTRIGGIAALVGSVGGPVISAVQSVVAAFSG